MKPLGKGSFILRGLLILAALITTISLTSFVIQNTFAQEDIRNGINSGTGSQSSESNGFEYSTSIPDNSIHQRLLNPRRVTATLITEPYEGITYGLTVEDALEDLEITLTDKHRVKPPLDFVLGQNTHIKIIEVVTEEKTEQENIPYEFVSVIDDTREIDTKTIVQFGRIGQKELTYEHVYINGILEEKNLIGVQVTIQPQSEITAIGTKKVFREMSVGGDSFSYWRIMSVKATSYFPTCEGCSNTTATGAYLKKGVCAVDPTVIPMFSRFYVPGYGFCQALDVGGAIKGNHIDLGFEDPAVVPLSIQGTWSMRNVDIYLLD